MKKAIIRFSAQAVAFIVLIAFTSCSVTRTAHEMEQSYSRPSKPTVENSKSFANVSFDKVWEAVIAFFASRQISIETLEKESGIVVAKQMLASGSDGDGVVKLGDVTTGRGILKQWLSPSRYEGSAVAAIVRSTGTITKQERSPMAWVVTKEPAACRSTISFNVFVSRFAEDKLSVTINVSVSTVDNLNLWNGWAWRDHMEGATLSSTRELISMLREHVQPTVVNPEPVTTGVLEAAFLAHLDRALGSAAATKQPAPK